MIKENVNGFFYDDTNFIDIYNKAHLINQTNCWKAAKEFCKDRLWEFKIITEDDLGIK